MYRLGAWEYHSPLIFSNLEESWSKGSRAARKLVTLFMFGDLFFLRKNSWSIGQSAPPTPNRRCLGTSLVVMFQSACCNLLKFSFITFPHLALADNNLDTPVTYVQLKYFIVIGADTFNKQYYSIT